MPPILFIVGMIYVYGWIECEFFAHCISFFFISIRVTYLAFVYARCFFLLHFSLCCCNCLVVSLCFVVKLETGQQKHQYQDRPAEKNKWNEWRDFRYNSNKYTIFFWVQKKVCVCVCLMVVPLHFTIHNVNDRTIFCPIIDISTWVAIITCRLTYYYNVWNLSRNAFKIRLNVWMYVMVFVNVIQFSSRRVNILCVILLSSLWCVKYYLFCALFNVDFGDELFTGTHGCVAAW